MAEDLSFITSKITSELNVKEHNTLSYVGDKLKESQAVLILNKKRKRDDDGL